MMTRIEAILDYYELRYEQIILDILALASSTTDREPESAKRIALCAARKQAQLTRARSAGLEV